MFHHTQTVSLSDWSTLEKLVKAYASDMSSTELINQLEPMLQGIFGYRLSVGHLIVLGYLIGEIVTTKQCESNYAEVNAYSNRLN